MKKKIINNKFKRSIFLLLLFTFCITINTVKGQVLLSESFNYPPGTLLNNAGWTTYENGTNHIVVKAGNLLYTGSVGNTFGNKIFLNNIGQDVSKAFAGTSIANTGDAIYVSMVVNVKEARPVGNYFFTFNTKTFAPIFIKARGNGYSFGIKKNVTSGNVVYEETERPFDQNVVLVLKYEAVTRNGNDFVKLYINPTLASAEPANSQLTYTEIGTADLTDFSNIHLEQGAIATSPTLEVDNINVGKSWIDVTAAAFDFGDTPVSYDTDKEGLFVPAMHAQMAGFYLGNIAPSLELTPHSVANQADNNGSNGDGIEEDGMNPIYLPIKRGMPYTIPFVVHVPATLIGTKFLYGWIDFNTNGKFESNELAYSSFSATSTLTQTLKFTEQQTAKIPQNATQLYMRLRLSSIPLIDYTGIEGKTIDERSMGLGVIAATNALGATTISYGEVEDYQLQVSTEFDYGDLPVSFEKDKDGNDLPALHHEFPGFAIGRLIDQEVRPASVTSPDQNNTTGDNAGGIVDEDGIDIKTISVRKGESFTLTVPIAIPRNLRGDKYLYGWLDLNGDGQFQANEIATTYTSANQATNVVLIWTAAQTALIAEDASVIYCRLRLSKRPLGDFTSVATGGALIDERSIGNGATLSTDATNHNLVTFGEVEDYQFSMNLYDFGDVPTSYELNSTGAFVPARHAVSQDQRIGRIIDYESTSASVLPGADNNGTNGDGLEEDGLKVLPLITKGAPFSFSVELSFHTPYYIIAWIDFNNDGQFQANEAAHVAFKSTTTEYQYISARQPKKITFWFTSEQTQRIPSGTEHLYVRIRYTTIAGSDNTATLNVDERAIGDGVASGIYTVPSIGEVEDYQFKVTELYDFGDAPESYDMDKNGTTRPTNFKPARNLPTEDLHLGPLFEVKTEPASVAPDADNNGANGNGWNEDGLSQEQLFLKAGGINRFDVAVTNTTGLEAILYAWIDFNNNGRFENKESIVASVPDGATTVVLNFSAVQVANLQYNTKVYMRLRLIQPDYGVAIADLTTNVMVDERAIADGFSTGEYGVISLGEVEDYQLTVIRDYGDVPLSYENGNPAYHTNSIVPELTLGASIDYELSSHAVAADADNNDNNGDGLDEDAISTPQTVTHNVPFSMVVPVNSTTSGDKYLYGWIDFNGDGLFNGNEIAAATVSISEERSTRYLTLHWANANLAPEVLTKGKTYARLRLANANLSNANTSNLELIDTRSYGGSTEVGEVEDYQFVVGDWYDYGDAPASYDMNKFGTASANYLPARQVHSRLLYLGESIETEATPNTVETGTDNNGTNGDGVEEDGFVVTPIRKGTAFYAPVRVFNNTGTVKYVYGWIDLNNNGRFEANEVSIASVPSSDKQRIVNLPWKANQTNIIPADATDLYMRLRISAGSLDDFISGTGSYLVDERAIGDGLSGTATETIYGMPQIGEIEDYRLPITVEFDYGDLPDTYETSRNDVVAPARQIPSTALFIGKNPTDAESAKRTSVNALGDNTDNINDEDGVILDPIYVGGGIQYIAQVTVTNFTGRARILFGWIDFNNDGRFQLAEVAYVTVPNATNAGVVKLTWANIVISGNPNELSMRLRLSDGDLSVDSSTGVVDARALADGLNTGEYAVNPLLFIGEIEDHKIPTITDLDYGDVPISYEHNTINTFLPARHMASSDLKLGNSVEVESTAQSVAAGADNNGRNGDGLEEDSINPELLVLKEGSKLSFNVPIYNNTGNSASLYAWIDFNNDGKFSSNEALLPLTIPTDVNVVERTIQWTIPILGNTDPRYLRLRLSDVPLADNISSIDVDERSIGHGNAAGLYNTQPLMGEIEDYQINHILCMGTRYFNARGGVLADDSDGIQIQMTGAGNLQVVRRNVGQLFATGRRYTNASAPHYSVGYQGLALSIGDRFFNSGNLVQSNNALLEVVGNTCLSDLGRDGGVQSNTIRLKATKNNLDYYLNVTYSYAYPNQFFNINYNIEIPEGNTEEVKLSHGWDTYLQGKDKGPGFKNGRAPYLTVGVRRDDVYEAFKYKSGVAWSGYYSGYYFGMSQILLENNYANTLNNYIDTNSNVDNGIGISMNFGSTPGTFNSNSDVIFKCNAPIDAPNLRETHVFTSLTTINLNAYYNEASLPTGVEVQWYNDANNNVVSDPTAAPVPGVYYAVFLDPNNQCTSVGSAILTIEKSKDCFIPPIQGNQEEILTSAGFVAYTTLERTDVSWIPQRGNAFMVLESNTKGFVVTRLTTLQINAIPADKRIPGMLVYDTTENCLKMYNGVKWGCLEQDCL